MFNLLSHLRERKLLDAITGLEAKARVMKMNTTSITTVDSKNPFRDILRRHIKITRPARFRELQHLVRHHILTKGPPCTDRARRLPPEKLRHAKSEIEAWIADGILSPSGSQYSSAMHMQRKKDGTWRICGDYRRLNRTTLPDKYSIPHTRFHIPTPWTQHLLDTGPGTCLLQYSYGTRGPRNNSVNNTIRALPIQRYAFRPGKRGAVIPMIHGQHTTRLGLLLLLP